MLVLHDQHLLLKLDDLSIYCKLGLCNDFILFVKLLNTLLQIQIVSGQSLEVQQELLVVAFFTFHVLYHDLGRLCGYLDSANVSSRTLVVKYAFGLTRLSVVHNGPAER